MGHRAAAQQEGHGERGALGLTDALLRGALEGDPDSLGELWETVSGFVARCSQIVCRKMGIPEEGAEDIAQEVLLRLCSRAPFEVLLEVSNREGWFYRVVCNQAIDYLRAKRREDRVKTVLNAPLDDEGATLQDTLPAVFDDPPVLAILVEFREAMESFLAENYPKERADALRLYLQGYRQREIASAMDLPIGTVGTWIARTRREFIQWAKTRFGAEEDR